MRDYVLRSFREALEIGAPGLSIDFCRYPDCIDKAETCNDVLRALRKLADAFGKTRGRHVLIAVRFPAQGVRLWERFDFRTWIREGLVDYLAPSNIQARHLHFDIRPYVEAVRGTKCKLLPCVDGLQWALEMPGPFLWRVKEMYEAGVDGIYVYQADYRVYNPADRRWVRMLGSTQQFGSGGRKMLASGLSAARESIPCRLLIPRTGRATACGSDCGYGWKVFPWGEVELYLDGKLINCYTKPPYILGSEERESDRIIPSGEHERLIHAQDGDGWLEQRFTIVGAK